MRQERAHTPTACTGKEATTRDGHLTRSTRATPLLRWLGWMSSSLLSHWSGLHSSHDPLSHVKPRNDEHVIRRLQCQESCDTLDWVANLRLSIQSHRSHNCCCVQEIPKRPSLPTSPPLGLLRVVMGCNAISSLHRLLESQVLASLRHHSGDSHLSICGSVGIPHQLSGGCPQDASRRSNTSQTDQLAFL